MGRFLLSPPFCSLPIAASCLCYDARFFSLLDFLEFDYMVFLGKVKQRGIYWLISGKKEVKLTLGAWARQPFFCCATSF